MRFEVALCCALALTVYLGGQVKADPLPLFDGHIHYNLDAPERYPPHKVVRILDQAGISGAVHAYHRFEVMPVATSC